MSKQKSREIIYGWITNQSPWVLIIGTRKEKVEFLVDRKEIEKKNVTLFQYDSGKATSLEGRKLSNEQTEQIERLITHMESSGMKVSEKFEGTLNNLEVIGNG